jgi:hypothetical protein
MIRPGKVCESVMRIRAQSGTCEISHVMRLALMAVVLSALAAPAHAGLDVITGDLITLGNGPGSPGGAFYVDVLARGGSHDFDTFCVELTEHVSFGTTYYVQGVGLTTNKGYKTLGPQTAWLYTQYLDKNASNLVGFDFVSPSPAQATFQANALQLGIWLGMATPYSLADITTLSGWSTSYINTLSPLLNPWLTNFQADVDNNLWSGTGKIQIMNLRGFNVSSSGPIELPDGRRIALAGYAQDQLVRLSPELSTLLSACTVVACGLLWGIVSVRRKRASAI